jgi:hypothetical protein
MRAWALLLDAACIGDAPLRHNLARHDMTDRDQWNPDLVAV